MKRFFRKLIRTINLVVAALLVLSFLSPHISPKTTWIPSFLGLAYPYILFLNLGFVIFWAVMKKREVLISILVLLLGWNTLTTYIGLHPGSIFKRSYFENMGREERKAGRQLKVMSFNIQGFSQYRWTKKKSPRQDILDLFREADADLLCLQEYFSTERGGPTEAEIFSALERTPHRHFEYTISSHETRRGIAIFSHYPIVATGRDDQNNARSIFTYADILVYGDTLRVYNLHLQSTRLNYKSYRLLEDPKLRYDDEQMKEIRDISSRLKNAFIKRAAQADRIAAHIAECPHPVIVCGDFNDTPISYTYHRIREGLRDSFSKSGWGIGRTYNGKFPSFRIDYILHSETMESVYFSRKKVHLSDHFPIISYLMLP
jgi:endonuclease/exonuclease/phosphatase family metal-dependent hydrolase